MPRSPTLAASLLALSSTVPVAASAASLSVETGTNWRTTGVAPASGWESLLGFDDGAWGNAVVIVQDDTLDYIWSPTGADVAYFRHAFDIAGSVASASLKGGVDDDATIWINGTEVYRDESGSASAFDFDIASHLVSGRNLIAVRGVNAGGPAAFGAGLSIVTGPSAVPEPATWAMMVAGFGIAGAALRRRRTAAAFA